MGSNAKNPLEEEFLNGLDEAVSNAAILSPDDFKSELFPFATLDELRPLYEGGLRYGASTGFKNLDPLLRITKKRVTVITGRPGSGKTTFLDQLLLNLMQSQNWSTILFSNEIPRIYHSTMMIRQFLAQPFMDGPSSRASWEEIVIARSILSQRFEFVEPDALKVTMPHLLEVFEAKITTQKVDCVVIDPWARILHKPSSMDADSKTDYVGRILTVLSEFAKDHDVHVFLVAHPTKIYPSKDGTYPDPNLYSISDSAHFYNLCDNGIILIRRGADERSGVSKTQVVVEKIRYQEDGKPGVAYLRFNPVTLRFSDYIEQESAQNPPFWGSND
jgi:twinkle protein